MSKELLISVISEDENLSEDEKSELIKVLKNDDVNKLSQKQVKTLLKLFRENSSKLYSSSLFPYITSGLLPEPFGDVMNWLDKLFDE